MFNHYAELGVLEVYREEFIRQAELRLLHLRDTEAERQGRTPVYGADIEKLRKAILRCLKRKAQLSYDSESIEARFSTEQRRSLYILLADLEENISWRFPWWEAMTAVSKYLEMRPTPVK
jgi:hypothetical protein